MKNRTNNKSVQIIFSILLLGRLILGQVYIPADPFDILFTEQKIIFGGEDSGSLMIRPLIMQNKQGKNSWSLKVRSELFYNDGAPNLENTSDKWVSKGVSFFTSANMAFNSKYMFLSTEPFVFNSQNKNYNEPDRLPKFMHLNDNRAHIESPYNRIGLRETQIYLKYNNMGFGWSNANMWWGPGLHSSLMMSNNTTGFGHLMIGTVTEQKIGDWGINGRYIFSKFRERSIAKPYYSGFMINSTFYSEPILTLGFSRSVLSGGQYSMHDISPFEAALLPFEIIDVETTSDLYSYSNPINQIYAIHGILKFPKSNTQIFFEWGWNDKLENFALYPDNSDAYNLGLRKYGLFNNLNFFIAIEYTNIARSSFWNQVESYNWYSDFNFDYHTYDGRNWAAHSGPDSDDFTLLIGYSNKGLSIMPSFNYERHSLTNTYIKVNQQANTIVYDKYVWGEHFIIEDRELFTRINEFAETKIELKLDLRYLFKDLRINILWEYEKIINYNFLGTNQSKGNRTNNIFALGIEKILNFSKH